MKIFLVGDYYSGTGPANATKMLLGELPKNTIYLRTKRKITRMAELIFKVPLSDVCVMSGYSKQNLYTIKLAQFFGKKTAYIMHGCVEYENEINGAVDDDMTRVERETMSKADIILAVSEQFEEWLKVQYPEFKDKIDHLTNGLDYDSFSAGDEEIKREANRFIAVGGGMPRKKISVICKAIQKLNESGYDLRLTIAGDKGKDDNIINSFSFVDNVGLIDSARLIQEYRRANIFISNSCFETFGLAPLEALVCGCSVLLSKQIGAWSLFDNNQITNDDKIIDFEDEDEIAEKLKLLLKTPNNQRLINAINKENTSWKCVSNRLQGILKKMTEKE